MSAKWKSLCRDAGLRYQQDFIIVPVAEDRSQQVYVDESRPDVLRIWSRVALGRQLRNRPRMDSPDLQCWLINRYRELVGFKVVDHGTVIGEAWIPDLDITAEEWRLYVETLAISSDRLEYLWTGSDAE